MGYAADTDYASSNLIQLITEEERTLSQLKDALQSEEAKVRVNRWDYETSDLNDDFSDAYVQAAFGRMAAAHQEAGAIKAQIAGLQASIVARQLAIQAMCGAVLQIAKQGISAVHGSLAAAPPGRTVYGLQLKDIIWQARNRALHYEDGQFNASVTILFGHLENVLGAEFSLSGHPNQSCAKQIVWLLGWTDYASFANDMSDLGL
jgi:hypothetical protein